MNRHLNEASLGGIGDELAGALGEDSGGLRKRDG